MTKEEINEYLEREQNNLAQVRSIMSKPEIVGRNINTTYLDEEMRILGNIECLKKTLPKPPLGVIPRKLWKEKVYSERRKELKDAMKRYVDAGLSYPKEWEEEIAFIDFNIFYEQ